MSEHAHSLAGCSEKVCSQELKLGYTRIDTCVEPPVTRAAVDADGGPPGRRARDIPRRYAPAVTRHVVVRHMHMLPRSGGSHN